MLRNRNPMSSRSQKEKDEFSESEAETVEENGRKVTYYSDGTSTVHFGGPCGPSNYDEYGEEC